MPSRYGEGRCAFCAKMGEPAWVGQDDINGTRMLAHKHHDPDPYHRDHIISGPDGIVAGNYDYDSGGIVEGADAALIVAMRNALPVLLDQLDSYRERLERALFLAEHLHAMVPQSIWRDSGGDDGQGHYEGDYRAEQIATELRELAALVVSSPQPGERAAPQECGCPDDLPGQCVVCEEGASDKKPSDAGEAEA
jgi:hypothetical protein